MKDEFVCGFGIAMADMMRIHPDDVIAHDVIRGAGSNLQSFIQAGLE